ncbi:MAG: hypothetical protein RML12_07400 [Xanthomonadales bacterium]|nr:hypothetical protein [Xanthomonadales bacterium]
MTWRGACIVTTQLPVPLQSPLQPAKLEPGSGLAVRVTAAWSGKSALQLAPQAMPAGALLTVPVPLPVRLTLSVIAEVSVGLNHQSTAESKLATPLVMKRLLPLPVKENWQKAKPALALYWTRRVQELCTPW